MQATKCPKAVVGDIQLETVLTPLLFPVSDNYTNKLWGHTPHDTICDLKLLDVGCGWGRLLAGLTYFPKHITEHINYIGCEPSEKDIEYNKIELLNFEKTLSNSDTIKNRFNSINFTTWDELLKKTTEPFDYIFIVNTLHHIAPTDLCDVFSNISGIINNNGYLIIHDFFFDEWSSSYDFELYCDDCVFFSPVHVSSFFAMASTQTGRYRTMQRRRSNGKIFDLFTFVIQFSNELSYRNEFCYDADIPPAIYACLEDIDNNIISNTYNNEWIARYVEKIKKCRLELLEKYGETIKKDDSTSRYAAIKWLRGKWDNPITLRLFRDSLGVLQGKLDKKL